MNLLTVYWIFLMMYVGFLMGLLVSILFVVLYLSIVDGQNTYPVI